MNLSEFEVNMLIKLVQKELDDLQEAKVYGDDDASTLMCGILRHQAVLLKLQALLVKQ